jgi:hypothetical protein
VLAGGGARYRSATQGSGLTRLVLKPASVGRARIRIEGGGSALAVPPLPLSTPLVVQLVRGDDPTGCWQAGFTDSKRDDATAFRAVTP